MKKGKLVAPQWSASGRTKHECVSSPLCKFTRMSPSRNAVTQQALGMAGIDTSEFDAPLRKRHVDLLHDIQHGEGAVVTDLRWSSLMAHKSMDGSQ